MQKDPGKPYITRKLDNALREEWRKAGFLDKDGTIITLAVVGGIVSKDNKLFGPDHLKLGSIVRTLKEQGTPLNNKFSIDWYNLLPPMRNDFLQAVFARNFTEDHKREIDALVILGVPRYGQNGWISNAEKPYGDDMSRRVMEDYFRTKKMITVSPWTQKSVWPYAADHSGARWVITWGGINDEISTDSFLNEDPENRFSLCKRSSPQGSLHSSGDEGIGIVERIQDAAPS